MFMLINAGQLGSFNDVPDKPIFKPIPAGTYVFQITEQKIEENSKKTGSNLVVVAKVDGGTGGAPVPDDIKGKKTTKWFPLPTASDDPDQAKNKLASIKQLFVGCGLPTDGAALDSALLTGAKFNASVKSEPYTDKTTGEMRDSSNIDRILKTDGNSF
jgi:hypothetical protein